MFLQFNRSDFSRIRVVLRLAKTERLCTQRFVPPDISSSDQGRARIPRWFLASPIVEPGSAICKKIEDHYELELKMLLLKRIQTSYADVLLAPPRDQPWRLHTSSSNPSREYATISACKVLHVSLQYYIIIVSYN